MLVSLLTLGCPEQLSGGYLHHCRLAELAGDHDAEVEFVPVRLWPDPFTLAHGDVLLVDSIAAWLVAPWAQRAANRRRPLAAILHQTPGGIDTSAAVTGAQLGYARVSTAHQSLDQQMDALTAAGVDATRVYTDKLSGTSTREQRPGLAALLAYARQGDAIVVVGIERLGRNAAEVMTTIRDLGERGIVLRSIREGIDTSNAAGRMVAGVLASLAELELELELGKERRTAARDARRARGQSIGRPKALDQSNVALAQRMHASGESASTIATTLGGQQGDRLSGAVRSGRFVRAI
jgi:DNA invertase Pin-like site-specific DNA recombinase